MPAEIAALYYHSIANDRMSVSPRTFRAQLAYLSRQGYRCIGLGEWLDEPAAVRKTRVALTFDDGFAGMSENVLPLLAEFGFRATFFIVPGYMGATLWGDPASRRWSRQQQSGRLACPLMDWEQTARLHRAGMEIGSHTMSHRNLTGLSEEDVRWEMAESRRVLKEKLSVSVRGFSYPRGRASPALARLAQESGYDYACVTQPDPSPLAPHRFLLPRVPGPASVSELFFRSNGITANPWTQSALRVAQLVERCVDRQMERLQARRRAAPAAPDLPI